MNGYTLFEITAALALMAVASSAVLPGLSAQRDRAAVLEAREAFVSLLVETRAAAVRDGAAALYVDGTEERAWVESGDRLIRELRYGVEGPVRLQLGGARLHTEIAYNGLGIGVFANETLEWTAGRARARLVVSSYGRVRRE